MTANRCQGYQINDLKGWLFLQINDILCYLNWKLATPMSHHRLETWFSTCDMLTTSQDHSFWWVKVAKLRHSKSTHTQ